MLRLLTLFALGLLITAPTSAQRGIVYANVGYLATPNLFDEDGERFDSGTDFAAFTVETGGELVVYDRPGLEGYVGAALHLAQTTLDGEGFENASSGFGTQNVILAARLTSELFTARTAALLDLGKDPDSDAEAFTTDGQHAVLFGGTIRRNAGRLFLVGGADAYLTFSRTRDAVTRIDDGDVFVVFVRGAVPVGPLTFGLRLQYVAITDVTRTVNGTEQAFPDSDSYQVGLIPSVTFRPPGSSFSATLQAGARSGAVQEYADYGIALAGKNAAAPTLALALRTRFEF